MTMDAARRSGLHALFARAGMRVIASLIGIAALVSAGGMRAIVDYQDLTCPAGTSVQFVGVAYWAVRCVDDSSSTTTTNVPTARYFGLFMQNVNARVFDADLIAGAYHGPALNVRLGR
jgi:hypothetical protein